MRRQHDLRMRPEGMAGGQRFGIGDVDHRRRRDGQLSSASTSASMVELRPAADMDERRAGRQSRRTGRHRGSRASHPSAAAGRRECRWSRAEYRRPSRLAMMQVTPSISRAAAAPSRKRKAEGLQPFEHGAAKHARGRARRCGATRPAAERCLPLAGAAAGQICRQVAMEREHGQRHIFLHHAHDAVLDHAHDLHRSPAPHRGGTGRRRRRWKTGFPDCCSGARSSGTVQVIR